jgi:hypothetical protein
MMLSITTLQTAAMNNQGNNAGGGNAGATGAQARLTSPEKYGGDKANLRSFLTNMEVYCSFYAGSFSNNQAKILAVNMHLKDKAAEWLQPYVADYLGLGSNLRMCTIDTQQILGL